ncbi:MAG: hypothetical protein HY746_07860 [Elusimicrobia bacterium]|nr:hypothetical protein [Elusimicrobiota bacterium]
MSVMTGNIGPLIELQKKDSAIDDLTAQIREIPETIQRLNAEFEEKKGVLSAQKNAIAVLNVSKKNKEIYLMEKEEQIKKHQLELNLVKDNAAFKALLAEIDNAKKETDVLETEILNLLEEIDKASSREKNLQVEFKTMDEQKNLEIKKLEEQKKTLEEQLAVLQKERTEFIAGLEEPVLSRYDYIRKQRNGLAVTAVKEDEKTDKYACGGCNMLLTPQTCVDIKKRDIIVTCENCQRMIYLSNTV